jgi:hypothetical protein
MQTWVNLRPVARPISISIIRMRAVRLFVVNSLVGVAMANPSVRFGALVMFGQANFIQKRAKVQD